MLMDGAKTELAVALSPQKEPCRENTVLGGWAAEGKDEESETKILAIKIL